MAEEREQVPTPPRISFAHIWASVLQVLNFEKGLFYTLRELTLRPAEAIKTYLLTDRTRLQEPIKFLFITVGIATFVFLQVEIKGAEEQMQSGALEEVLTNEVGLEGEEKEKALKQTSKSIEIFNTYFQALLIFTIPFSAFFTYLHFRKHPWNGAEHLVLNCYIFGYQSFFYGIAKGIFFWWEFIDLLYILIYVGYVVWVISRFFEIHWMKSFFLTLWILFLSSILYGSLVNLIVSTVVQKM